MRRSSEVSGWPGLELAEELTGGTRSEIYRGQIEGKDVVVRVSSRTPQALDWELQLMSKLSGRGLSIPGLIRASDGACRRGQVFVQDFIRGRTPESKEDWQLTVATLKEVHVDTLWHPQRPGFRSSKELLSSPVGGDVDLRSMPSYQVDEIRQAWALLRPTDHCVIHGDVGGSNVIISAGRAWLIDWDESRVDHPDFDYAFVPQDVVVPSTVARGLLETVGVAWEAATSWVPERRYAQERLRELGCRLGSLS